MSRKKRKIVNAISEALAFLAIVMSILAISWAFWICGDFGPDHVEKVLMLLTAIFGGGSLLIGYLAGEWL